MLESQVLLFQLKISNLKTLADIIITNCNQFITLFRKVNYGHDLEQSRIFGGGNEQEQQAEKTE